ncbi:MAG: hypothetical protein II304_00065 [Bacteroidales bacterium]|jgi:hypothetical protein|nr:hypothetical protein [Bacteroidales bacterium]
MKGKKILQVFRTYTDAYLEYVNNWLDYNKWANWYEIDYAESQKLLDAVNEMRKSGKDGSWSELDYFYNVVNNNEYTEIDAIF